jgi:hypothetical protein
MSTFDNRITALEHDIFLYAEFRSPAQVDKWRQDLQRLRALRDEEFAKGLEISDAYNLRFNGPPSVLSFPSGETGFRCRDCGALTAPGSGFEPLCASCRTNLYD